MGVSTGVPGFRIGTGPRGNYVRVGAGGVYYRATLGARQQTTPEPTWQPPPPSPVTDVLLEDITGATATELLPTGSGDIVEQLNEAAGRWRLFPWVLGLLVVVLLAQPVVGAILLLPGVPGLVWLWFNDRARRTVVAFYDVNDAPASWFQGLVDAAQALAGSQALWRVAAAGNVRTTYQYKVNAGANTIVSRKRAGASNQPPAALATNIAVPSIAAGKSALYFLPDRLLVKDAKRFSDISYSELQIQVTRQPFIESQRLPRDAAQVDTTWQYVNVKGGPDRRFKNNRQLPIMLYGELELTSGSGLHWLLQCSQPAVTEQVASALQRAPAEIGGEVPA